jgi:hypothetical protein
MELTVENLARDALGQRLDGFVEHLETCGSGHVAVTGGGRLDVRFHDSVLGSVRAAG